MNKKLKEMNNMVIRKLGHEHPQTIEFIKMTTKIEEMNEKLDVPKDFINNYYDELRIATEKWLKEVNTNETW